MAYMTDENGNYKRTVRCGHCYEKGHNKSACPKRKQDLKDNIEHYTKELANSTAPADDWQRQNMERYLRRSKDQLHKMETRGKNRKCGFCGEVGHTRRTCPDRKAKVSSETANAVALRKEVAERMIIDGYGPGALVQVSHPVERGQTSLAVITKVHLDNMRPDQKVSSTEYFNGHRGIEYQYVIPMKDRWGSSYQHGSCYVPLEYMNTDDLPAHEWYRDPNNPTTVLLSGVVMSEDILLPSSAVDKKQVSKWITDNVVDPK